MITVILAGGSGTRLWPLSTSGTPKHLLSVTGEQTLLQDALVRAKLCGEDVYVVTDASHSKTVREQLAGKLEEKHIIVEPDRRGTGSCIILALAQLAAVHTQETLINFMHADHHISDQETFRRTVQAAGRAAYEQESVALIGLPPRYPATGFGYIKRGERISSDCYRVEAFQEKPDLATAEEYVSSGDYLWNLGLFSATLATFLREIKQANPELFRAYEALSQAFEYGRSYDELYADLPVRAIEPAVIEKAANVVVVPGAFDWMDIGSFKDLHEAMPKSDEHANAIEGEVVTIETSESIVMERTGRPVAVLGLENVAIISTEHGLLVCHKEYSQRVREAAETFNSKKEADQPPPG